MYGQGISKIGEILDLGVKAGLVEKSDAGSAMIRSASVRAAKNARKFLTENPELMERLEKAIRITVRWPKR